MKEGLFILLKSDEREADGMAAVYTALIDRGKDSFWETGAG